MVVRVMLKLCREADRRNVCANHKRAWSQNLNVASESLEALPVRLDDRDRNVASLAGVDVPHQTRLARVNSGHDFAAGAILYLFHLWFLHVERYRAIFRISRTRGPFYCRSPRVATEGVILNCHQAETNLPGCRRQACLQAIIPVRTA